jgi:hypothetical protein
MKLSPEEKQADRFPDPVEEDVEIDETGVPDPEEEELLDARISSTPTPKSKGANTALDFLSLQPETLSLPRVLGKLLSYVLCHLARW